MPWCRVSQARTGSSKYIRASHATAITIGKSRKMHVSNSDLGWMFCVSEVRNDINESDMRNVEGVREPAAELAQLRHARTGVRCFRQNALASFNTSAFTVAPVCSIPHSDFEIKNVPFPMGIMPASCAHPSIIVANKTGTS
jgi:hypothetical protein